MCAISGLCYFGILNPRKDVISQTTEQTAAYAVAEAHAASPQEAILDQTIVYFNKLLIKTSTGPWSASRIRLSILNTEVKPN